MHEGSKGVKRVLFVIPSLAGGGAERVILHILKYIDRSRFEPHLAVFEKHGELVSEVPYDIQVEKLKERRSLYGLQWLVVIFKLTGLLKKRKIDAVVSFMWYTNLVVLIARILSRVSVGVVVSERYGLSVSFEGKIAELLRRLIIRFFYPGANAVIVNSMEMGNQISQMVHMPKGKIITIYNPVDLARIAQLKEESAEHPWFRESFPTVIGIGRLTRQKGFDYLIRAIRILKDNGIECRLALLGKGSEEENLKRLASELGVSDRVLFAGFQQNPYKYLARSTVFALSSLYEGFPNVLLEALSLGIPSVATRCPTGPEELIADGINGLLVPPADERALAEAIKRLLLDEDLRKRLSDAGKKRAEDFGVEKIIKQYEEVIERVCAESAVK